MAGPLLTKKMLRDVKKCICKDCHRCPHKNCAGCENPITSKVSCITCFPHSPKFIHPRNEVYA